MRYIFAMLVAAACSNLQIVLASLYPTCPTSETVFTPGRQTLTWKEKGRRPYVAELGPLKIDLCTTNGTPIITLASDVNPSSFTHSVVFPDNLPSGRFVITFLSGSPRCKFYTSDFNFTGSDAITDTTVPYALQGDDTNSTLTDLVFVLPATTVTTQITPTAKVGAATTISAGPLSQGGTGLNQVHIPSSANRKGSKSRHAKYRMVFIAWPALIGISMAL